MRSHNAIDRSGQIFNHWTIVSYSHTDKHKKPHYLCRCVCGKEIVKTVYEVTTGESKSCGCMNIKNHIKHGKSNQRVHNIWQNIKNRTLNPKSTQWKWYGGRARFDEEQARKMASERDALLEDIFYNRIKPELIKQRIDDLLNLPF